MYTIVEAKSDFIGSERVPPSRKLIKDGETATRYVTDAYGNVKKNKKGEPIEWRPYWWGSLGRCDENLPLLPQLYGVIKKIEDLDHPWVIIREKVKKRDNRGWFRLSVKEGYLEANIKTTLVQLDIDGKIERSNANTLPTLDRLELVRAVLPFLTDIGMVVQLSNKAGLSTKKDYLAMRIWVELDKPEYLMAIKKVIEPFDTTNGGIVDASIISQGRIHLAQRPEILGNIKREINGESVIYIEGNKLNLDDVRKHPTYLEHQERHYLTNQFMSGVSSLKLPRAGETSDYSMFDGIDWQNCPDGFRYQFFYRAFQRRDWCNRDAPELVEFIAANKDICGNHPKAWLQGMADVAIKRHQDYFNWEIGDGSFEEVLPDPKQADLKEADLTYVYDWIENTIASNGKFAGIIKSGHGTAKTTALLPNLMKRLEAIKLRQNQLTRTPHTPLTMAYITTLRSIVKGVTKKLGIACYILENGKIDKELIWTSPDIGIGMRSIHHLHKNFDFICVDESEQIGLWAHTFGDDGHSNHNILIELCANTRYGYLLMDADASVLTRSIFDRANKDRQFARFLLKNSETWVRKLNQNLYWCKSKYHLLETMYVGLEDPEFRCFLHYDGTDKEHDHKLKSIERGINSYYGETICKTFSPLNPQDEIERITRDPDRYIKELFDRGIRCIGVSPIIVSGWRPITVDKHFNATFGLYEHNFMTAPTILQRMMRPIQCKDHFIYLRKVVGYSREFDVEKSIINDYKQSVSLGGDVIAHSYSRAFDAFHIKAEAAEVYYKQLSNVPYHLSLLWTEAGGTQHFFEELPKQSKLGKELRKAILEEKRNADREHAEEVFGNPALRAQLEDNFVTPEGEPIEEIKDWTQTLELLKQYHHDRLYLDQAREIYYLLTHDEDEWNRRIIEGWEFSLGSNEGLLRSQDPYGDEKLTKLGGFNKIGKVLNTIVSQLDIGEYKNILHKLWNDGTITIDFNELDTKEYVRLRNQWNTFINQWFPTWNKQEKSAYSFIRGIFGRELQCYVSGHEGESGEKVKVKNELREHYQGQGFIAKKLGKEQASTMARRRLFQRIESNEELDDVEENYLRKTGGYLVIEKPETLSRPRWFYVKTMLGDALEKTPSVFLNEKIS